MVQSFSYRTTDSFRWHFNSSKAFLMLLPSLSPTVKLLRPFGAFNDIHQRNKPSATFCNVGSQLKDRRPDANKTATSVHALLQTGELTWRRASEIPRPRAKAFTRSTKASYQPQHANPQEAPSSFSSRATLFPEDFNSKASTAPTRPLQISVLPITPLPYVAKAESAQEKKQETSQKSKHGKCT